jgi:fimbrial chaperone protein
MRRFTLFGLSISSLLLLAMPAQAFKLLPLSQVFAPTGAKATQSYEIENTTGETLAVELTTVKREMDLKGVDKLIPANDEFMLYPPQVLLQPGERQTVRVTWLGNPQPEQELAYRLIAEQLPIDLAKKEENVKSEKFSTSIKIQMRYLGSIYIRPNAAKPQVVVEKIETKSEEGKPMLAIMLNNQGNARANLKDGIIEVNHGQATKSIRLTPQQTGFNERPTLLAKHKRQILIPYPAELSKSALPSDVSAKLELPNQAKY